MSNLSFEKVVFAVSVLMLVFLYGYSARQNGLFPDQLIRQVQQEASDMWYRPSLTTRVYERHGVRIEDSSAIQPGLTFVNSLWKGEDEWYAGFQLINRKGETLHRWRVDREALFPNADERRGDPEHKILHGSHLFPNGDVLFNTEYVGAVRMDACGNIRWRLPKGNHHSVERAEDGTFWISGLAEEPRATSTQYPNGFPGIDKPVWLDQLHHVSADGTLLERLNVLDILYSNDLERYIVKALQPQAGTNVPDVKDITHLNDVEPLSSSMADEYPLFEAGDLLVSLRKISLVFVFDPDTGRIKWHTSDPLIMQHDPDFIGEGWIGIFDNRRDFTERGTMLGGSRIVTVQPHTDSVTVPFPTSMSDLLYTTSQGMWQQLSNGNMLLAEAKAGRILEVDSKGRTVWEWIIEPYDESKVSRISEMARYDLSRKEVASWPCSLVQSPRVTP